MSSLAESIETLLQRRFALATTEAEVRPLVLEWQALTGRRPPVSWLPLLTLAALAPGVLRRARPDALGELLRHPNRDVRLALLEHLGQEVRATTGGATQESQGSGASAAAPNAGGPTARPTRPRAPRPVRRV